MITAKINLFGYLSNPHPSNHKAQPKKRLNDKNVERGSIELLFAGFNEAFLLIYQGDEVDT